MSATEHNHPSLAGDPMDNLDETTVFSTPLGSLRGGRLVFASQASRLELKAGSSMPYLCQARFRRFTPQVWVQNDLVTVEYSRPPLLEGIDGPGHPLAEISLNASVPWEIEFLSGVSGLKADLDGLQLRSLDFIGGAHQIEMAIPRPTGTSYIYAPGGIHEATISRPIGVGMRIQITGGATELFFDDQHLGAVGGEMSLESPNFKSAAGKYELCIAGGASHVTITEESYGIQPANNQT